MQEKYENKLDATITNHFLPIQENICQSKPERDKLRSVIQEYVNHDNLIAPLSLYELSYHAREVLNIAHLNTKFQDYASVLLHNELWSQRVSQIPYDRRLLLLPRCLRHKEHCLAQEDTWGLICAHCGNCPIHDLQTEAQQLGYMVMIAEGSPIVMALIESGKIETVIGVSCLSVLEKVFPYMEAAAVPGIAIPLLRDGCTDTYADMDWIWEAIYLNNDNPIPRLDLNALKLEVQDCFDPNALAPYMGSPHNHTEKIALQWLAKSGKRWRPFLAACVYQSLRNDPSAPLPDSIRKLLIAIECFHKASLIHDDIEDNDNLRYGEQTLHVQYGVPIALNIGDILVGDGYRLIAELDIPSERKAKMLHIAAIGHRTLCQGQGAELCWQQSRTPLTVNEILDIYKQKTAPAFEVALRLGAIYSNRDDHLGDLLQQYSTALGIAYQIKDDFSDSGLEEGPNLKIQNSMDISLLMALTYEKANHEDQQILKAFWYSTSDKDYHNRINQIILIHNIVQDMQALFQQYKNHAFSVLSAIDNPNLKCVLHRVIGKIFGDLTKMGCCNDNQK